MWLDWEEAWIRKGSVCAGWGQGEREKVGGNEAGFVQRALNATTKDSNLIL